MVTFLYSIHFHAHQFLVISQNALVRVRKIELDANLHSPMLAKLCRATSNAVLDSYEKEKKAKVCVWMKFC